jgi:hypothetical protein
LGYLELRELTYELEYLASIGVAVKVLLKVINGDEARTL